MITTKPQLHYLSVLCNPCYQKGDSTVQPLNPCSKIWYQHHKNFDELQRQQKHFVCRIKRNAHKPCLEKYDVEPGCLIFYDAKVLPGQAGQKQTEKSLRPVGYYVDGKKISGCHHCHLHLISSVLDDYSSLVIDDLIKRSN